MSRTPPGFPRLPSFSRRTLLSGVGLGVTASVVAACGGRGLPGTPLEIVHRSPGLTEAAGPWRVVLVRTTLRATGVVDWANDRLMLSSDDGTPEGRKLTDIIQIGSDVWTRTPPNGPWQKGTLDPNQLLSLPGGLRSGDILATLELAGGAEESKVFGGQQVQSASTIRYTTKCDPVVAAQKSTAPTRKARLMELPKTVNHLTRLDVYVDAEGRVRRMDLEDDLVSATPTTRNDGARFVTTMELLEPGVAADIKPPI